jgi:hypothetical protein
MTGGPTDHSNCPAPKVSAMASGVNLLAFFRPGGPHMFDVYLSDRRHLLVVRKGLPIPAAMRRADGERQKRKL